MKYYVGLDVSLKEVSLARAWCANGAALAPRQAGYASRLDRSAPDAAADKRRAGRHGQ